MRVRLAETDDFADALVVVVTFTRPRNLPGYRRRFAEPLPVLTDQDRALYRMLGLGRGSVARVWGWRSFRSYVGLLRSGGRLDRGPDDRTNEDTLQLGGNAVIDAEGRLSWLFRGSGPDDRPSVDELVEAVRRAGGQNWANRDVTF